MSEPEIYHIVFHRPGPNWQSDVDYRDQDGVSRHVAHYASWHNQGKLHMGGPFLAENRGGMMIAKPDITRDELETYAAEDPAIKSGLLIFEVVAWYVPMENF